ncbi:MAG TPA: magnesium chelatase domain-containing protein, partial [Pseudonocardiaceae bacterium]
LWEQDVYAATVGGMKMAEPASDLAVALAVASAFKDDALPPRMVAIGEVGLAGEVRRVPGVGRRLAEAARLGFDRALIPPDAGPVPDNIRTLVVPDLRSALDVLKR